MDDGPGKTLDDQTPGGRSGSACFEDKSFHGGPDETTDRGLGMHAVIHHHRAVYI